MASVLSSTENKDVGDKFVIKKNDEIGRAHV